MGDFDSQIASSRELLAIAWRNLQVLQDGKRQFRDGVEITDDLIAKLKQDIVNIQIRIAAYESRNEAKSARPMWSATRPLWPRSPRAKQPRRSSPKASWRYCTKTASLHEIEAAN
jgi:hypothetical protein